MEDDGNMNDDRIQELFYFFIQSAMSDEENCGMLSFDHEGEEQQKIITVYSNDDGMLVFNVFEPEEWEMINGMCEFTDTAIEDYVSDLSDQNLTRKMIIDPKNFQ
jgi:hypothetical protein